MDADTRHKVEYRLELAEYDLETAKVMLEGRRYLYVGFMCHQVVEKALKACTWSVRGIEPEHTHSPDPSVPQQRYRRRDAAAPQGFAERA